MIDRLIEKIDRMKNPSTVGLDPTYEMIPKKMKKEMLGLHGKTPMAVAEMFIAFNKGLIDSLHDIVPAVKLQSAMYEKYGPEGIRAYIETANYAKEKEMIVIGDIKRGDISTTAAAYAAYLSGIEIEGERIDLWNTDAVTLNPYMGYDAIEPFIKPCNELDKGIFVLVKTSNPSGEQLQDLQVTGWEWPYPRLYQKTAKLVKEWGKLAMGQQGYSKVGAVVGAGLNLKYSFYDGAVLRRALRKHMPNTFFLVPGYGAQGGKASEVMDFFDKDGRGCVVNSSRGIIAAYKNDSKYGDNNFGDAARASAMNMKNDIRR